MWAHGFSGFSTLVIGLTVESTWQKGQWGKEAVTAAKKQREGERDRQADRDTVS